MRALAVAAFIALCGAPAAAADLTVNQCLTVLSGIEALRFAGAPINDARPALPDAKQYKLGALRVTLALNMAALQQVSEAFQRSRNQVIQELGGGNAVKPGTPEDAKLVAELQKMLDQPCSVHPAKIAISALKPGDGADENQIPLPVIAALAPILQQGE